MEMIKNYECHSILNIYKKVWWWVTAIGCKRTTRPCGLNYQDKGYGLRMLDKINEWYSKNKEWMNGYYCGLGSGIAIIGVGVLLGRL